MLIIFLCNLDNLWTTGTCVFPIQFLGCHNVCLIMCLSCWCHFVRSWVISPKHTANSKLICHLDLWPRLWGYNMFNALIFFPQNYSISYWWHGGWRRQVLARGLAPKMSLSSNQRETYCSRIRRWIEKFSTFDRFCSRNLNNVCKLLQVTGTPTGASPLDPTMGLLSPRLPGLTPK